MMPSKRHQTGNALMIVMVLISLGVLLLVGMQKQLETWTEQGKDEQHYWKAFNQGLSSLEWGISQRWQEHGDVWQCRTLSMDRLRVCLHLSSSGNQGILRGEGQLAVDTPPLRLYQRVASQTIDGAVLLQAMSQGWLDFCPEPEARYCVVH
ncbi:hypothetical protein AU512_10895 [Lonsdalea iberica]|uniref:DUF2509 domain-containing protein n=1 Tax=Lonsdalea iberica TaxID=1082703 RepID=A0A1X3RPN0_9GAMM|nr:YgdB family protein [Lonsdalea iberica]OSN03732.1 hypothetical protein AU511_14315 [Lonsdalea iberica]OSN10013.1 hypothetical protein AU512_10895 [Lonsdalea iberica]